MKPGLLLFFIAKNEGLQYRLKAGCTPFLVEFKEFFFGPVEGSVLSFDISDQEYIQLRLS